MEPNVAVDDIREFPPAEKDDHVEILVKVEDLQATRDYVRSSAKKIGSSRFRLPLEGGRARFFLLQI